MLIVIQSCLCIVIVDLALSFISVQMLPMPCVMACPADCETFILRLPKCGGCDRRSLHPMFRHCCCSCRDGFVNGDAHHTRDCELRHELVEWILEEHAYPADRETFILCLPKCGGCRRRSLNSKYRHCCCCCRDGFVNGIANHTPPHTRDCELQHELVEWIVQEHAVLVPAFPNTAG